MKLGSNHSVRIDVRVLAATNRNLEEMLQRGAFREDLYYRLNVIETVVPPLRERAEEGLFDRELLHPHRNLRIGESVSRLDAA